MIKKMSSIKLFYLKKKRLVLEGLELAKSKKKKKICYLQKLLLKLKAI